MKTNQIKHIGKVYNWMVVKGIDLKDFEPSNYQIEPKAKQRSSFKKRAEQVKDSFNHKFTPKRDISPACF